MPGPDCPFGVDYVPKENERVYGSCDIDDKPCWNSTCANWNDHDSILGFEDRSDNNVSTNGVDK